MKVLILIAVIGCVSRCLDGKDLNPPIFPEEDDKINGQAAEHLNDYAMPPAQNDGLPLLMKTLRLRPGSEAYNKIVDEFVNSRQHGRDKRGIDDAKEKIPPFRQDEDDKTEDMFDGKRDKRGVESQPSSEDLPLLMKTLRLRPGSDAYQKVVDDFLRSRAGEINNEEGGTDYDQKDDDPRLLGEPLIGSNRHPSGDQKPIELVKKDGPADKLPLLLRTLRLRPGSPEYQKVIDEFLKNHEVVNDEDKIIEKRDIESGKPKDNEPPLLGENMIGRNRRPKHDGDREKRDVEAVDDNRPPEWKAGDKLIDKKRREQIEDGKPAGSKDDLPLLMKTLRLRPGSDDYQKVVDEFLKGRTGETESLGSDSKNDEPRLPGEPLIGSNRHPPNHGMSIGLNQHGKPAGEALPLLMKTLRLRPGSKDYERIVDNFIHGNIPQESAVKKGHHDSQEHDDDDDDHDHHHVGVELIAALPRKNDHTGGSPPNRVACKEEDMQQVFKCFRGYYKNYGIELKDGKLPTKDEFYPKLKTSGFKKNRQYFLEFAGCYKSTPEACYHTSELTSLTQSPLEADYLAVYFSVFDFAFKSKHNKKVADCFFIEFEKIVSHENTDPIKDQECDANKEIYSKAVEKFHENCGKTEPQEGDLRNLLAFMKRTSLETTCPTLLDDIGL